MSVELKKIEPISSRLGSLVFCPVYCNQKTAILMERYNKAVFFLLNSHHDMLCNMCQHTHPCTKEPERCNIFVHTKVCFPALLGGR